MARKPATSTANAKGSTATANNPAAPNAKGSSKAATNNPAASKATTPKVPATKKPAASKATAPKVPATKKPAASTPKTTGPKATTAKKPVAPQGNVTTPPEWFVKGLWIILIILAVLVVVWLGGKLLGNTFRGAVPVVNQPQSISVPIAEQPQASQPQVAIPAPVESQSIPKMKWQNGNAKREYPGVQVGNHFEWWMDQYKHEDIGEVFLKISGFKEITFNSISDGAGYVIEILDANGNMVKTFDEHRNNYNDNLWWSVDKGWETIHIKWTDPQNASNGCVIFAK